MQAIFNKAAGKERPDHSERSQ